ncbi:MAG: hypothetical protein IKS49_07635 [Actinomycetaceae bacterium]|nr:hypothetical protein [Actinomycetaceae bacterium]
MQGQASTSTSFSAALYQAITDSRLSLAQIVSQLSERGFKISRTTLSQWQTGTSFPRRASSRMLTAELEKILALPPQTLTSLLPNNNTGPIPRLRNSANYKSMRTNTGGVPTFNSVAKDKHFQSVEKLIDPAHEVIRETISEHLSISADFRTITQDLSVLVRIPDTDTPTMHTTVWWTKDDEIPGEDNIGFYDLKGAFPATTYVSDFDDGLVKITRLEFPPYTTPGSLHNLSYKLCFHYDTPITETTGRLIASKMRYYSCSITFEEQAPQLVHWVVSRTNSARSDISHVIETREMQPHDGELQVILEDAEYVTCFFRWG